MPMSGSLLPSPKEPIAYGQGRIAAVWYRLLAHFERLINGAVSTPGTGLAETPGGALTIADGGVSNEMLRDSVACSVIGNPLNSTGTPQDISAAANDRVLQRTDDQLVFGYLKLASFTIATVPLASNNDRVMIYVSNESGGATLAFSDGTNWRRVQDRAIIS
jgi:hypothetical protein